MDDTNEVRSRDARDANRASDWPYASLLIVGVFGVRSSAAKRLFAITTPALLLAVASLVGLGNHALPSLPDWIWAMTLPLSVATITWANARYLESLDELAREIQLQAMAFSYGAVMLLAALFVSFMHLAGDGNGYPLVRTVVFFGWLVIAEPLRGLALVVMASRYG